MNDEILDLANELVKQNIEHTITMAYLETTNVLCHCNELDYNLYLELKEQISQKLELLKKHLVNKYVRKSKAA